jgi:hypothetical protein
MWLVLNEVFLLVIFLEHYTKIVLKNVLHVTRQYLIISVFLGCTSFSPISDQYSCVPLINPPPLEWKSGLRRGVVSPGEGGPLPSNGTWESMKRKI